MIKVHLYLPSNLVPRLQYCYLQVDVM